MERGRIAQRLIYLSISDGSEWLVTRPATFQHEETLLSIGQVGRFERQSQYCNEQKQIALPGMEPRSSTS